MGNCFELLQRVQGMHNAHVTKICKSSQIIMRLALWTSVVFSKFFACLACRLKNGKHLLALHTWPLPAPSWQTHSPSSFLEEKRWMVRLWCVPLRMVGAQLRTMMSPLSTRPPPSSAPVWSPLPPHHLSFLLFHLIVNTETFNVQKYRNQCIFGVMTNGQEGPDDLGWFSGNKDV